MKRSSIPTLRTSLMARTMEALMRLSPVSYFWICCWLTPSWSASSFSVMCMSFRLRRTVRPTCLSTSVGDLELFRGTVCRFLVIPPPLFDISIANKLKTRIGAESSEIASVRGTDAESLFGSGKTGSSRLKTKFLFFYDFCSFTTPTENNGHI